MRASSVPNYYVKGFSDAAKPLMWKSAAKSDWSAARTQNTETAVDDGAYRDALTEVQFPSPRTKFRDRDGSGRLSIGAKVRVGALAVSGVPGKMARPGAPGLGGCERKNGASHGEELVSASSRWAGEKVKSWS